MNWVIDKTIEGCYGHRVWSQKLDPEFALTANCKCKHPHGHQLTLKVYLTADKLESGMVTDFHHLNWLKEFIDDYIDHKFIIDKNDPAFLTMTSNRDEEYPTLRPVHIQGVQHPVGEILDWLDSDTGYQRELQEGFFVVDFVPTSENLCKWIFDFASEKMKDIGIVTRVDWHETPKSRATYKKEL